MTRSPFELSWTAKNTLSAKYAEFRLGFSQNNFSEFVFEFLLFGDIYKKYISQKNVGEILNMGAAVVEVICPPVY